MAKACETLVLILLRGEVDSSTLQQAVISWREQMTSLSGQNYFFLFFRGKDEG